MFRKFLSILSVIFLFTCTSISASDKNFSNGVILDETTGLSGKYRLSVDRAVDAALVYSFLDDKKSFALYADYVYHQNGIITGNIRGSCVMDLVCASECGRTGIIHLE